MSQPTVPHLSEAKLAILRNAPSDWFRPNQLTDFKPVAAGVHLQQLFQLSLVDRQTDNHRNNERRYRVSELGKHVLAKINT